LTWFKNSEPLPASTRLTPTYDLNTCMAILKIEDGRPSDVGKYRVLAENVAGRDETSANATVFKTKNVDSDPLVNPEAFFSLNKVPDFRGPIELIDPAKLKPPKFIITLPGDVKLQEGEKALLKCKVEGYPIPEVFICSAQYVVRVFRVRQTCLKLDSRLS